MRDEERLVEGRRRKGEVIRVSEMRDEKERE